MPSSLSSSKFNEDYYKNIWGTVHRHDYCDTLASQLFDKYGACRILDIGTGCGYLVKRLRELGCEAFGLDISEYAVSESHGNVLLGSVVDMPFKDKCFDVVHSQGLWEYVAESDIERAYAECLRVGRIQVHNYDTIGSGIGEENFATLKSREWWEQKLQAPKILIACPTYEGKEYCFDKWIAAVKALDYPNKELLVVDNSPTLDFYNRWKNKVPMVHLELDLTPNRRIAASMEYIRQQFLKSDAKYWFNVESDIMLPSQSLQFLLGLGEFDWYEHHYPYRETPDGPHLLNGFGCTMFSKKVMQDCGFTDAPEDSTTDGWFWNKVVAQHDNFNSYKVIECWNALDIKHLNNG